MFLAKPLLASLIFGTAIFAAGCQSTGSGSSASTDADENMSAVACDKCETTFKKVPVSSGNARAGYTVVGYRTAAKHECPDCRNIAKSFLTRGGKATVPGRVVHECKTCGGEIKECHVTKM